MKKKSLIIIISAIFFILGIAIKNQNAVVNNILFIISYLIVRVGNIKKSNKKYPKRKNI